MIKESALERNMRIINDKSFDRFDKLIIIEAWFQKFSSKRQVNLIKILKKKMKVL